MPTLPGTRTAKILTVAGVLVIAAALHLGQSLLVPLAIAILLSLILSPLVGWGERMRLSRALSVVTVVALVFGILGLTGFLVAGEAATLANKLPEYRSTALAKLEAIRIPFAKTVKQVRETVKDVETAATPPKEDMLPKGAQDPTKVEVVEAPLSPWEIVSAAWGPFATAGGYFSVVLLLTFFFLIYKMEIRDRIIRLAGDAQVNVTMQTMTDAARGVSRYLFVQTLLNASFGVVLGAVLYVLGVPGAVLWGFLAAVLRYIPYVGPIAAGALPVLLAFGVFPGWTRPLLVASFIIVLEILVNNLFEPIAYGKRTGLSPLAVVLATVFWAWMWGGAGMILAVPLTVCLVSVGKHVPSFRFLTVALGDEPVLDPKLQVYQRLLGQDQMQAVEILERELAGGKSLAECYDGIVLPVLRMVVTDLQQGKVDEAKAAQVMATLREIVDDLAETARSEREKKTPAEGATERSPEPCKATVICIPASTKADELSAHMLTQVLNLRERQAKALAVERMAGETMEAVQVEGADILVICISPPSNLLRARYLYKRLRSRFGEVPVVEGMWGDGDARAVEGRIAPDRKATFVSSFVEADETVGDLSREAAARNRLREGVA